MRSFILAYLTGIVSVCAQQSTFVEVLNRDLLSKKNNITIVNPSDSINSAFKTLLSNPISAKGKIILDSLKQSPIKINQIIDGNLTWTQNTPVFSRPNLKVCFYGHTKDVKFTNFEMQRYQNVLAKIKDIAQKWSQVAGVDFSFNLTSPCQSTNPTAADIRIVFRDDRFNANWSWLGSQSKNFDGISMCLQGFLDQDINSDYFKSVILHEFGHALGLEHEHQHPDFSRFCDINVEAAMEYHSWSRENVVANYGVLKNINDMTVTTYDPTSIMHYSIPPAILSDPDHCPASIALNSELSQADITSIRRFYPITEQEFANNSKRENEVLERYKRFVKLVKEENKFVSPTIEDKIDRKIEQNKNRLRD